MRFRAELLLAFVGVAFAPFANSTTVFVTSVGERQAQVIINGTIVRSLGLGETSSEGVTLKSIENGKAEFEIDGKSTNFGIGQSTTSRVVLQVGRDGHVRATANVNGMALSAIVDTGASTVVMGSATAIRVGINYRSGRQQIGQTANGKIMSYLITLPRIQIGNVVATNVACNVLDGAQVAPDVDLLIGNSFLSQVQMRRSGTSMTLTKSNGL